MRVVASSYKLATVLTLQQTPGSTHLQKETKMSMLIQKSHRLLYLIPQIAALHKRENSTYILNL
jgi:hypothetical protein